MLKIQEIREIIKLIDQSDIEEFSYEHEGSKVEMKKRSNSLVSVQAVSAPEIQQPTQVQTTLVNDVPAVSVQTDEVPAATVEANNYHKIKSPMVGTFYQSSSPDTAPYVQNGSVVQSESIVCIIEAMKLFNEIEAEIDGEIVEVLAKDGELVEYGQTLFLVKPR